MVVAADVIVATRIAPLPTKIIEKHRGTPGDGVKYIYTQFIYIYSNWVTDVMNLARPLESDGVLPPRMLNVYSLEPPPSEFPGILASFLNSPTRTGSVLLHLARWLPSPHIACSGLVGECVDSRFRTPLPETLEGSVAYHSTQRV